MKIKVKGLLTFIAILLFGLCVMIYIGTDNKEPQIKFGEPVPVYAGDPEDPALLSNVTARDGRDGDVSDTLYVDNVRVTSDGTHATITYIALDRKNNVAKATQQISCVRNTTNQDTAQSTTTVRNEKAPVITLSDKEVTIGVDEDFDFMKYVETIEDDTDDIEYLQAHIAVSGDYEKKEAGTYELTYSVYDSDGNESDAASLTLIRK